MSDGRSSSVVALVVCLVLSLPSKCIGTGGRSTSSAPLDFDVVVYGASPGGIAAAITAANGTGLRVALLEPSPHVGGMSGPGGIGLRDTAQPSGAVMGGLRSVMHAWLHLNDVYYKASGVLQPDATVAQDNWNTLVADPRYNLTVVRNAALDEAAGAVVKSGLAIKSIRTVDPRQAPGEPTTTWTARVFIDASYEADVLIASGADWTYGREPNSTYKESLGGILPNPSFQRFRVTVDPFWPNGTLLDGVDPSETLPLPGDGDDRVMPSSYRACITTDKTLRAPWPRPANYDETRYELLIRLAVAMNNTNLSLSDFVGIYPYNGYPATPTRPLRYDLCENGELSTDQPSHLYSAYVIGNRTVRASVRSAVLNWVAGWAYTLANSQRIPAPLRASASSWGLCNDAWPDTGHWPEQMYVREGARLVGDWVATQVRACSAVIRVMREFVYHKVFNLVEKLLSVSRAPDLHKHSPVMPL